MAVDACTNCGDGCGWVVWRLPSGELIWAACGDCNDDETKPKPPTCPTCGYTAPFCVCPKH